MRNIIVAIAKRVDEKHGEKLLTLDPESKEMKMRFKAMEATYNGGYVDLDNPCTAASFAIVYTTSLIFSRVKNLFA